MVLRIKFLSQLNDDNGAATVTRSNHPAVLRFSAQADQITELMRWDEEFAGICSDYAEIVGDIAEKEHTLGRSSTVLADFLRLRAELERDMLDKLGEVESDDSQQTGN